MSAAAVRLLAFDLDGTLLDDQQRISPRNQQALRAARSVGIHTVVATGRGRRSAQPLVEPVGVFEWMVCSNGSSVHDLVRDDHRYSPIDSAALAHTIELLAQHQSEIGLSWELTDQGFAWNEIFPTLHPEIDEMRGVANTGSLDPATDVVLKLLLLHPSLAAEDVVALLRPVLPPSVSVTFSSARFVEITGAGVDKSHGLSQVCAELGIDASEVVVFGDSPNDIEMFAWAGRAVAMGNAHPSVLPHADEHTGHHLDDGVAQVIEAILSAGTGRLK